MAPSKYQPAGEPMTTDAKMAAMARDLEGILAQVQKTLNHDTLVLKKAQLRSLAEILVEFAEDLHCDNGLWRTYEQYNMEFFGVPLPLTSDLDQPQPPRWLSVDRFQHLLWVLYPQMIPGLVLAPSHVDLVLLAETAQAFLRIAFQSAPRHAAVKTFLRSKNTYAWDVKRKLVWLGTNSYLFRVLYENYMRQEKNRPGEIGHTDDFLCQECTAWSGLGPIDILAGVLDISDDDRRDLRAWYERHASFYEVKAVSGNHLNAVNVVNTQPYMIRVGMECNPLKPGQMILGSLVPWRGEWYWSGEQKAWDKAADFNYEDIRNQMKRTSSQIVCRFWKEYEAQVRERAQKYYEFEMAYYGKDLIIYPDGLSMAADFQKALEAQWRTFPPETVQEAIRKHELTKCRPNMSIPKEVLDHKSGVGIFIHPEGMDIMLHFDDLVSGLRQRGRDLTDDQAYAIRSFIEDDAASPGFVKRLLGEYRDESVPEAYLLREAPPDYWLEYLLRRHKGCYYRRRYPCVAVI
jgi:hypothetical protein